jgi:hypothetical protein
MESKLLEDEQSEEVLEEEKPKRSSRSFFNYQVREYEKNLIHKLPNELRNYVINYNYRASSDERFHIDTNDY